MIVHIHPDGSYSFPFVMSLIPHSYSELAESYWLGSFYTVSSREFNSMTLQAYKELLYSSMFSNLKASVYYIDFERERIS